MLMHYICSRPSLREQTSIASLASPWSNHERGSLEVAGTLKETGDSGYQWPCPNIHNCGLCT